MSWVKEWVALLRNENFGVAYSSDGWRRSITEVDVAWLCRALIGEAAGIIGPPSDAVAWCMINRWYLMRDEPIDRRDGRMVQQPWPLHELLLAYCQPINPYWRNRGTEEEITRRNRIARMTPGDVERQCPGLIEHTIGIVTGQVSGEPYRGLVHFNTAGYSEARHGEHAAEFGDNWFWYSGGSESWSADRVQVSGPTRPSVLGLLVPVGLQAVGAATVAWGPEVLAAAAALPFLPP